MIKTIDYDDNNINKINKQLHYENNIYNFNNDDSHNSHGSRWNAYGETYTYAVKGQDTLKLDVYTCLSARPSDKQLAYVYSYGGGWESGTRADAKMMQKFARKGYVAISIDYRRMIERMKKEDVNVMDAEHCSSYSKAIP